MEMNVHLGLKQGGYTPDRFKVNPHSIQLREKIKYYNSRQLFNNHIHFDL